ncbi:MAG: T9SS type A sorting domain-containing protein [Muribaculum sp.]|nr:T9SS type A sorting domain-containing protein [Muribaculum sp.]
MKNKVTLTLMAGALTAFASMGAVDKPTAMWGKLLDGASAYNNATGNASAGDIGENVVLGSDGNLYWHMMAGTYNDSREVLFGGEKLFEGSDYDPNGTSHNNNLCVLKTDQNGNVIWNLHSTTGDYSTNEGLVAATTDGGVVFSAKVRCTDMGGDCQWEDLTLVDGTGKEWKYAWTKDKKRYQKMIVGRMDANGSLLWLSFLECDRTPAAAASGSYADFQSEAIKSSALTCDSQNNVYIGGNYRNPMHISGSDVVLTPHNVSTWNGDPQQTVGDLFIVKFDGDGKYVSHVVTTGTATSENVLSLSYAENKVFVEGLVYGTDGDVITLAGKNMTIAGAFTPVIVALDTDLNATWIKVLKGEKYQNKYGFQNTGLTVCGDYLWFTGMFNGVISDPDNADNSITSSTPSVREGFILKLKSEDGSWVKGVTSLDSYPKSLGSQYGGITGYFKAIANPEHPEKVYVYGYVMNAKLGIFLRSYDAESLVSDPATGEWSLVLGGSMPTCHSIAYDKSNGRIFIMGRGRNQDFTLLGGLTVKAGQSWGELCAGFEMPNEFISTESKVISIDADNKVNVIGTNGGIVVENSGEETVNVAVYDFTGRLVMSIIAPQGKSEASMPAGLYIAGGHKIMVK